MKRIRIGNNIHVSIILTDGKSGVDLSSSEIEVYLNSPFNSVKVDNLVKSGNTVEFDFTGSQQKYCGSYFVTLKKTNGSDVFVSDSLEAFKLVDNSVMSGRGVFPDLVNVDIHIDISLVEGNKDYNLLYNKPRINGTELEGNVSLDEIGAQAKGNYALKSEIPDTSVYVEKEDGKMLSENNFTDNFRDQIVENTEEIKNIKSTDPRFQKYFTSESKLKAVYPYPKPGDTAWVGEPYPGKIYICEQRGVWTNTNVAPDVSQTVDLEDYVTKDDIEQLYSRVFDGGCANSVYGGARSINCGNAQG